MQTTNTLHIQRCSVPGCMNDALVTYCAGKHATAPKGICQYHSLADLDARAEERRQEDALLRDLGFTL